VANFPLRRWAGRCAIALAVLFVVAMVVLPATSSIKWVGRRDLEVRFIVKDVDNDQPIQNAEIHITAEGGGFCEDQNPAEFTLETDDAGWAKRYNKSCMCFGSRSQFEDTFASHVPSWRFTVTADRYASSGVRFLEEFEIQNNVQRGDQFATLDVLVRLSKVRVEK
jgi:hypothetical protein